MASKLTALGVCETAVALMHERFGLASTCAWQLDIYEERHMFRLFVGEGVSVHFRLKNDEMENTVWWVIEQILPAMQEAAFKIWESEEPIGPAPSLMGCGFMAVAELRA
jgi:hypothetical protein